MQHSNNAYYHNPGIFFKNCHANPRLFAKPSPATSRKKKVRHDEGKENIEQLREHKHERRLAIAGLDE